MLLPLRLPLLGFVILAASSSSLLAAPLVADRSELIFSGVHAETSQPEFATVFNHSGTDLAQVNFKLSGPNAAAFKLSTPGPFALKSNAAQAVGIVFCPAQDQLGALHATGQWVDSTGTLLAKVDLYGLSAIGIEGPREPGLDLALATLGLKVNIGWTGHHTHIKPELVGDEVASQRFHRANHGPVNLIPLARYSPNFLLPFGFYQGSGEQIKLTAIGTLALASPGRYEHNCLNPSLASGDTAFDPGTEPFGLFTSSPTHVAYTQDEVNARFEPTHIPHATRIYAANDRQGRTLPNSYLVCFEEASNGDYQDYVFLITNVTTTH